MVRTRSGNEVFHSEASYGRAARTESARQRKKRKTGCAENKTTTSCGLTTPMGVLTRQATSQMDEDKSLLLATPPSASIRAGPTPSPKTDQLLRATTAMRKPRCTDFGTARRFAFQGQGYFFCSSCDLWDALPADTNKKVSMDSLMFGCKANHKYFSHPTALRNDDCYIRRKGTAVLAPAPSSTHVCPTIVVDNMLLDDAIESEEESNCSSSATTPTRSSDVLRNVCHDNDVDEISTSTNNNQPLMDDGSGVADNFIIPGSVTCSDPDDTRSPLLLRALVEQLKGKLALLKERNRRLLIENKKLRNDARLKERNDRQAGPTITTMPPPPVVMNYLRRMFWKQ
ncbi:hypothetical protein MHU86_16010 [Fragilaria crotonensis]|nr:hypothetical protein MHU86_16010 [Fragilaria crotonensis]